ncbi:hypothetical protein C8R48DRAFT_772675 [Suillus tomentosus]|nr:hypothetical protein C8R48DRAFT_772675 [Suillus tomentosus]
MSKRTSLNDGEHTRKRTRIDDGDCQPAPLADAGAWEILEKYLATDMTYPQLEEAFSAYLGDRYIFDDWKDARDALFSGDGDNSIALANLRALKTSHIPLPSSPPRTDGPLSSTPIEQWRRPPKLTEVDRLSSTCVQRSGRRPKSNPYILTEADEDDEEEEEEEEEEGPSVQLPKVVRDLGPSVKDRLAATFDAIFDRVKGMVVPSEPRQVHHRETVLSFRAIKDRMYLLHVDRHSTDYVAEHLRSQGFNVTASIWTAGQLYVVADSPRTIAASLPSSHAFAVKRYIRISEEEREAVNGSVSKLPHPAWVRVRYGKHKGDIGYVFDSDQSNGLIAILIPPRCFPYPMPSGSVALLDRLRLPNNQTVRDLNRDGKVIGCSYKGEQYYMGLVLKHFHRDRLELVASPHADDIQLHMQSGFDTPFVKKTLAVFSMQFLRIGDSARVISGELRSKIGTVVSTDHASGSVCLEIILDGHRSGIDVRLEDIERVFCVGDEVRVVAGPYLGLEGHIIQISDDMFHVCQDGSKEELFVSRYYLDRRPLHHTLQPWSHTLQHSEPPPESESLQVGDHIEVLVGEHFRKCSIVEWIPLGGIMLWFRDVNPVLAEDDVESSVGSLRIQVPVTVVRRIKLQIRSNIRRKGAMTDHSLIDVPITFVIKKCDANSDSFNKVIGQEVFIVGGELKGYRATLYDIGSDTCIIALNGRARTTLRRHDVVTSYGKRLNGAMLEGPDLVSFCDIRKRSYTTTTQHRSITPPPARLPSSSPGTHSLSPWTTWTSNAEGIVDHLSSSVAPSLSDFDPWVLNPEDTQDNIDARAEKLPDSVPLPWLMGKEYSSTFLLHHAVLKVAVGFMGGRLHKRFVSTACPDRFCGVNGLAPENCVAVFCTSSNVGAAIQHYHIPAKDLSPAPPRKKNQQVFVLDGEYRGNVFIVIKCNVKKNTVEVAISPTTYVTLRFDQAKNSEENAGEGVPRGI